MRKRDIAWDIAFLAVVVTIIITLPVLIYVGII